MNKSSKSLIGNALVFTTLMLGNIDYQGAGYIDDDEDFETSKLIDLVGSFSLNKAEASDIEIIQVNGVRGPSGTYINRLNIAINHAYNSIGTFGGTEDQEDYHTSREQEMVCGPVHDAKPTGCTYYPNISPNGCSTNGIGSLDGWSDYFNSSCNSHDVCYIKLDATRQGCDDTFLQNMSIQCNSAPPQGVGSSHCRTMARTYYDGVRIGGGSFFAAAQQKSACWAWFSKKDEKGC